MLYKYRGISSFRFLADILLKSRLYAAPYLDLNDPMEGQYLINPERGDFDERMKNIIVGEKEKIRICSLSRTPANPLMWSHYSEGARGVVIGLEVSDRTAIVRPVEYGDLPILNTNQDPSDAALNILSRKLSAWQYEEEERVFIKSKHYVDIVVRELILGERISNQDKGFLRDLCEKICPNVLLRNA